MTRLRSNAIIAPSGRPRSNAVHYGNASFLSSDQARLLEELRQQGIRRGIQFLGAMDVHWEALAWDAAGSALNAGMGIASPTFGIGPPDVDLGLGRVGVQDIAADKASEKIGEFFKKILEKARQKLRESVWIDRAMRLMGLGIDVLMAVVKRILLSKEVIGAVIPFWNTIKGSYQAIMAAVESYRIKGSIEHVRDNAGLIGSGIPSVAMKGFESYLQGELKTTAAVGVYTFAKTLADTLLTIFTAGASKILTVVSTIVELIVSWVHLLYQAWVFSKACTKCREWDSTGSVDDFEDGFTAICAGCPLIGAYFFSVADHIGTINLTSMFAKGSTIVADSMVWTAGAQVFEIQKLACEYITKVKFEPKFRTDMDRQMYGHWLEGIKSTASLNQTRPDPQQSKLRQAWTRFKGLFR